MSRTVKKAFARELVRDDDDINLAYAAMLFATHLAEPFDPAIYLRRLDEMTEAVRSPVLTAETDLAAIERLNRYLFEELKFAGDADNYYHPHNSFLNKVLELRKGIPISLSVIYLELGWRLGLPVWGGGLPGHFIVGFGHTNEPIYIDVFNEGRILSEEDCLALVQVSTVHRAAFKEQFLKPASKKAILLRMLLNLKNIYVRANNWATAYETVDLMLVISPDVPTEIRDRGLLAYRLNHLHEAVFDLERYLFLKPGSTDAEVIKGHLGVLEEKLMRLN
jgi:regulator of sirC expression with transglutaminase-like and TPR domain